MFHHRHCRRRRLTPAAVATGALLGIGAMTAPTLTMWGMRLGIVAGLAAAVIGVFRRAGRRQPLPRPRTSPPGRKGQMP